MGLVSAVPSAPHLRKRSTVLNGGGDADSRGGGEDGRDASLSTSASRLGDIERSDIERSDIENRNSRLGTRTMWEQSNASALLL